MFAVTAAALLVAMGLAMCRALLGPTAYDRVLALNNIGTKTVVLIAAIFQHSNVRLPKRLERALGFVIITPAIHWIHHHAVRNDTDSNYGTLLSLWDRLFGSLSPTQRHPEMLIGVEYDNERSLGELLMLPFGPQKPDMNKIENRPAQQA